jgi:hypothetical protein
LPLPPPPQSGAFGTFFPGAYYNNPNLKPIYQLFTALGILNVHI